MVVAAVIGLDGVRGGNVDGFAAAGAIIGGVISIFKSCKASVVDIIKFF
jgi:hypothetical protein